jgi:small subunit ribosomal protein S6
VRALTKGRSKTLSDLNQYEIAVLYHPDLEVDLSKAEDRVKKIVTDNGGKITATDNWGKRKLAYNIAGNEHAVYVFYTVELPGAAVAKVESTLNITNEVIRFLITRPDLKAIAKAEAMKAEKAEQAAKRGDQNETEDEKNEE